ncbi:MAG: RNA methyltransferase [Bdellovibrionales bacterium]|nr:RNA methyltransferase [Bdellovibrionales bacterium]
MRKGSSRNSNSKKKSPRGPSSTSGFSRKNLTPSTRKAQPSREPSNNDLLRGHRLVVGIHSVKEVFKVRPNSIKEFWVRPSAGQAGVTSFQEQAESLHIPVRLQKEEFFNRFTSGHQGVGVLVNDRPEVSWGQLEKDSSAVVLVLDELEDPHNLGAILRTAWLMDVKAVFCSADRAVGLTPTVCKVASGGAEHVPVQFDSSLGEIVQKLKSMDFWCFGLAGESSKSLYDLKLDSKVAWILGAEDKGLRKPVARACDELIKIPQLSADASYNVSVATAFALGETHRQKNRHL